MNLDVRVECRACGSPVIFAVQTEAGPARVPPWVSFRGSIAKVVPDTRRVHGLVMSSAPWCARCGLCSVRTLVGDYCEIDLN